MDQDEVRRWKARLEYADGVWREKGLSDESPTDRKATRFIDYYRGRQEGGVVWQGVHPGDVVLDNVVFSVFNTLAATLYARNPMTDVVASRKDQAPNAGRMERLLNHLIRKPSLRVKREMNRVLLDAFPMPFGVVRHGFTPAEEKTDRDGNLIDGYDPARPDFPWIQRVAPWDFRVDPTGQTLHPEHAWWCAFRSMVPLEHLKKNPNTINRRDLRPTHTWSGLRVQDQMAQNPDEAQLCEVWTVYDKERREWFQLTAGSDLALRNPAPWPIPSWRTLPYNLLQFNELPNDPFGVSYGQLIAPLQDDLNRCMTLALELAKRMRRVVGVNGEALAEGEAEKLAALDLMEWVFTRNGASPSDVFQQIPLGGGFQELLVLAQYLKNEIRALVGVGELERAQRINVETATEAQGVMQGAAMQRGRNQGPWEDFFSDVLETWSLGIQDTVMEEVAIAALGNEDAAELFRAEGPSSPFEVIRPEQIQGDFLYRIRPGSTLPADPNEEARKQAALNAALMPFGAAINQAQLAVDTILAFERDPRRLVATPQMMQAMQANQAGAVMAEQGPPQVVDPQLASLSALLTANPAGRA